MANKHACEIGKVYECLFIDMRQAFPELEHDFVKDEAKLELLVRDRGLSAYLVDLPRLGKHLDRCLSEGRYVPSGLAGSKPIGGGVQIPCFMRGLYYLIFSPDGPLKEDYSEEAILFLRQFFYMAKKYRVQCSFDKVRQEIDNFVELDSSLPTPNSFWDRSEIGVEDVRGTFGSFADSPTIANRLKSQIGSEGGHLIACLDFVSSRLCIALGHFKPESDGFKHGPGAVSDAPRGNDKYCWSNWSDRLENVFPIADYGFHSYSAWATGTNEMAIGSSEPVARLIDVPKTYSKPRLIASESREQQWCQQNIWHNLRSRVSSSWIGEFIKFDDQTRNQELARKGSMDGSIATVDLSAASDCVTGELVGHMFRDSPSLVCALQATRTRLLEVPGMEHPVALKKFSTMGSAVTFPVQSLCFLVMILSATICRRKLPLTMESIQGLVEEVSVFGDDLIIPTDSRELCLDLLEAAWFRVNRDKSFWTGKFRESCGLESFNGCDITPVSWLGSGDGNVETTTSLVGQANNFHAKWLLTVSRFACKTAEGRLRKKIPLIDCRSTAFGIHSFVKIGDQAFLRRWSQNLQRWEIRVPSLVTEVNHGDARGDSRLHQYFTEQPSPFENWRSGPATSCKRTKVRLRWAPETDYHHDSLK